MAVFAAISYGCAISLLLDTHLLPLFASKNAMLIARGP